MWAPDSQFWWKWMSVIATKWPSWPYIVLSESKLWRQPFLWFWIVENWVGNSSCVSWKKRLSSFLFAWSSVRIWCPTIWFWRQTVHCITQAESLRNSFSFWMFQHFIALKDLGWCLCDKMMVLSKSSFTSIFHYQRGNFDWCRPQK